MDTKPVTELKKANQVSSQALSKNSLDALKNALKEQSAINSTKVLNRQQAERQNTARDPRQARQKNFQAVNQRRLAQIRNQENIRQINRVYQKNPNQQAVAKNGLINNQRPVLDTKSQELADYLAKNGSLEGLSLEEAIQKRIESLQRVQREFDPDKDPFIELGSLGGSFAGELREAQMLSNLDPALAMVSQNLQELLRSPELVTDEVFLQNLTLWLTNKRGKRKYLDEGDLLELLIVEFYPILLAALTKVFSRGVSEEEVSTQMLSFNGELVQMIRAASDPSHPSHGMLKTVQGMCQYTDVVKWDDLDLI